MKSLTVGLLIFISVFINGCTNKIFSVGEAQSYCDENGCDYTDVGVCASPLDILVNKDDLSQIKQKSKGK